MMQPSQIGSEGRYALRPDRVAGEFSRLPAEVQTLLRLCDGTRNLSELRRASHLAPQVFELVLGKLRALGLIEPFRRPRILDRSRVMAWANHEPVTPFSLDEEAFFGKTIDHLLEPEERAF